jgi:membrane associated rhomboid family serine protease
MRRGGTVVVHDAHLGGALFGILFVLLLNIEKGKEFLDLFF